MKGYKGFSKDLMCQGHQFALGETYTFNEKPILCQEGFHFCENPLDVFNYYPPSDSRFAEISADEVSDQKSDDSKRVCKVLKIGAELSLSGIIAAGVSFILQRINFSEAPATNTGDRSAATNTGDRSAATNTGDRSAATNTGYQSAATNTGDRSAATNTGYQSAATNTGNWSAATNTGYQSAATNTGYQSAATNTGYQGCAISLGIAGKAKGAVGCWLTIAEWKERWGKWKRIDVQTKKIDGKQIKADVFYILKGGKFVVAE